MVIEVGEDVRGVGAYVSPAFVGKRVEGVGEGVRGVGEEVRGVGAAVGAKVEQKVSPRHCHTLFW